MRTCHHLLPRSDTIQLAPSDFARPEPLSLSTSDLKQRSGAGPLLPVNLDVLFRAAIGDGDHYPDASQDYDANHDPGSLDILQNAQLPECGENATDEQDKSEKIHSCPFHGAPPDRTGSEPIGRSQAVDSSMRI